VRLYPQSKATPSGRSLPRSVRLLVGACASMLVVGASTLGLGLGAAGVNAEPLPAKSPKKILLQDPLSKSSSAMPGATFADGNGSGSFVKGKYVLQNTGVKAGSGYSPTFDATGAQLSAASVAIDMSFPTSAPNQLAGLNCRQGDTFDNRYVFLIASNGSWLIGKSTSPPATNTPLKRGTGKLRPNETVHLRAECSGPEQPGPSGKVTLKFFINGKNVATVTDATSALPVKLPGSIGMEVDRTTTAAFSNITVAQL
jgi:hypothetical protein